MPFAAEHQAPVASITTEPSSLPHFTKTLGLLAGALLCSLLASTASAHFVEGSVFCTDSAGCPATPTKPLVGYWVAATGEQGNVEAVPTAADGSYHIELPEITQNYTLTVLLGGPLSFVCPASGQIDFFLDITVNDGQITGQNFAVTGCAQPPGCPGCVDPDLGLGAAAGCTVLQLGPGKVSITGPAGGIHGDICIAPNSSLSMSGDEYVTGTVNLGPGAKFSNSSHGTVNVAQNVDLSAEITAAYAAAANAASLPCTASYAKLDGKAFDTITGGVGINVICVGDIVLGGKQLYLTGPVGAKFIINVTGKLVLTGGGAGPQIRVAGGVQSKDVLYNIIDAGADVAFSGGSGGVDCCAAVIDGTLLAPYRKINLSPGMVNGQVISGKDISIVSGSSVRCPPCP